jgi:hypothetical protein
MKFDWDELNIRHLARHEIGRHEAEQLISNRPLDLESHLRDGEERVLQVGETDEGRIDPRRSFDHAGQQDPSHYRMASEGALQALFRNDEKEWQCWKN